MLHDVESAETRYMRRGGNSGASMSAPDSGAYIVEPIHAVYRGRTQGSMIKEAIDPYTLLPIDSTYRLRQATAGAWWRD